MIYRFLLFGLLLMTTTAAIAGEQFLMNFELVRDKSTLERGRVFVTETPHTWSKGLRRSYVKLSCQQKETGGVTKLFTTVDLFNGLSVTHQLVGDNVEIKVVRSQVKPRLSEIRALSKNECKELSPVVTTVTQSYRFPAKDGLKEFHAFSENTVFRADLQSMN